MRSRLAPALMLLAGIGAAPAWAGSADVVAVEVDRRAADTFDVRATIHSDDRGDDYYADAFEVLTPDGKLLGRRTLLHPHGDEQPFTRTLEGLHVPAGIDRIVVRAHHKPRGYDGESVTVRLPR